MPEGDKVLHRGTALSVWQPWAWPIVHGFKDVENRFWSTKFRGRLFIHASKRWGSSSDHTSARLAIQVKLLGHGNANLEFIDWYVRADNADVLTPEMGFGAIVGEVTLDNCTNGSLSVWGEERTVHWRLSNAIAYKHPIPYRGHQSLFKVEFDMHQEDYALTQPAIPQLILADGTTEVCEPANGKWFVVEELQTSVDGYFEFIELGDGRVMVVNEDGQRLCLDLNEKATELANSPIVGNVLVATHEQVDGE